MNRHTLPDLSDNLFSMTDWNNKEEVLEDWRQSPWKSWILKNLDLRDEMICFDWAARQCIDNEYELIEEYFDRLALQFIDDEGKLPDGYTEMLNEIAEREVYWDVFFELLDDLQEFFIDCFGPDNSEPYGYEDTQEAFHEFLDAYKTLTLIKPKIKSHLQPF